jgi:hypothetical protein
VGLWDRPSLYSFHLGVINFNPLWSNNIAKKPD